MTSKYRRTAPVVVSFAIGLAACGGGSDGDDSSSAATQAESAEPVETDDAEPVGDETLDSVPPVVDTADEPEGASLEAGPIEFRAVNLLDEPVDLYARTTGLVEAELSQAGLAPGEVSEWIAPPPDGVFLATEAGAGDPTCVVDCDHFVAELFTFPEEGPTRTVVLWGDEFDPTQAFELWDQPTADAMDAGNAMPPARAGVALAIVTAVALTDADFGVRAGTEGVDGCLEAVNTSPQILVGGNQTPAFALTGADSSISFFDRADEQCAGDPVGGPFAVGGAPGSRSHVILSGSPGAMDAIVVALEEDAPAPAATEEAGIADRELAVELMTEQVALDIGLDPEQSACTAALLVDTIGADRLLDGDALVDLDSPELPQDVIDLAGQALVRSVDECGVDPAVFEG